MAHSTLESVADSNTRPWAAAGCHVFLLRTLRSVQCRFRIRLGALARLGAGHAAPSLLTLRVYGAGPCRPHITPLRILKISSQWI
eukprot:COSAG06_NODE_4206_length_4479_cov_2.057306_2_plen_85_part_00